ncbi:MAG: T4 family baseplate hub assembly chaperone [Gaiellaceae bacterium]
MDEMTEMQIASGWQATVTLPVGLFDDETGELLREVTLRKMTGNEEAAIADPKLRRNGGKLVTALVAGCARVDGKPLGTEAARRLTSADRNFLLLEVRRLTFGDVMPARYTCPRCGGATSVTEDLAEIPVRTTDDGAVESEVEVSLDDGYRDADGATHRELAFRLPTGEDEEASHGLRDDNPSRQRDALITRCLLRVGELEPRRMRALGVRILADLSMGDRRLLQRALEEAVPGPDLTRAVVCDHCLEEFRATLDMSHFFAE